jgi:hypothetical protein
MNYVLNYEVPAETAYEAIIKASDLLRTGVSVTKVESVEPTVPGWYEVKLAVHESVPEYADVKP